MSSNPEIHLSQLAVAIGGGCCVLVFILIVVAYRLKRKRRSIPGGEPNWSVPTLDAFADRVSFFHQWDPRFKIISLFIFCFLVVSLHTLLWSCLAFALAILAALFCRIPLHRAGKRLLAMAGFLSMFLLVLPLTAPLREGETLVFLPGLPGLPLHMAGFHLALTVVVKACAVALMMEPLFATAPFSVTLAALSHLGIPASIGQMVLLSHRYIFVFLQEMIRMYRGMRVRGFVPTSDIATMNAMGNFLGMLFVRSFERTQRVYDAMLCRGYEGSFPSFTCFNAAGKDWAKALLWGMMGLILHVIDRIF
ncbi:MAG: cobalt ECF transporter T component CbiQ [Pseudomonadota bacterium]